jgi:hypothetical protein
MNFAQLNEVLIAKVIQKCENEILKDHSCIEEKLKKIAKIADVFNDHEYATKIRKLGEGITQSQELRKKFLLSVEQNGLYFEAPNFVNFDINNLQHQLKDDFNVEVNEDIIIPLETLKYMKEKLDLKHKELPDDDIVVKKIFTGPLYLLKLKQESSSKFSARDFGSYKSVSKQPRQGRGKDGEIGSSARLGNMELDGLIAHGLTSTIHELRTLKNDATSLKEDLIVSMITDGTYQVPENYDNNSYIKQIIDACITFLSE